MNKTAEKMSARTTDVVIHGRHAILSDRFKEHVLAKLGRTNRFALSLPRIDVEITHEQNPRQSQRAFEIELTCAGPGPFVRAKAAAADKYAAFDLAMERFEEQLRRMHERSKSIEHRRPNPGAPAIEAVNASHLEVKHPQLVLANGPLQVELKHPEIPELSVEAAIEHMELSGLKFLIFFDSETRLQSVLYPRHGYDYGLMQLGEAS